MSSDEADLNQLTGEIIRCSFVVSNELGAGFLEKVYENALAYELRRAGLAVEQQKGIQVVYRGIVVGEYAADLVVNGRVIVELKAVKAFDNVHYAQCLNYSSSKFLWSDVGWPGSSVSEPPEIRRSGGSLRSIPATLPHNLELLNYLKATGMEVCLLINFGLPKIEIKRFIN